MSVFSPVADTWLGRSVMKDTGHFNCRDYYISPEIGGDGARANAPSYQARRSPMNAVLDRRRPFRFFDLPLELRQKVYNHLLPYAGAQTPIASCRSASTRVVRKRPPIIWTRGQTNLLHVSKRMHEECAALLYGRSMFMIFVTYSSITFRCYWLLPNGFVPTRDMELLESFPPRYLHLLRQVTLDVEHPDSYTGMIKYNVGGKGLTYGVKKQVERLAAALLHDGDGLNLLRVYLTNGNDGESKEVQEVLEPLRVLRSVTSVQVGGATQPDFARSLEEDMMTPRYID